MHTYMHACMYVCMYLFQHWSKYKFRIRVKFSTFVNFNTIHTIISSFNIISNLSWPLIWVLTIKINVITIRSSAFRIGSMYTLLTKVVFKSKSCSAKKFPSYPIWASAQEREMGTHKDREKLWPLNFDHHCSTSWATRPEYKLLISVI